MKKYFSTLLILICLAGIVFVQYIFDAQKKRQPFKEPLVLKPQIIKAADLGLHNAAADTAWLSAIQYFGGGESRTDQELSSYLFLAIDLDPKFAYPYAFGALILPSIGFTDKGIELAKKGVDQKIPDWRISYYLATTYHINKDDPINAAKYFDIAANTPGVPDGIKKVAARYGSRSDKREQTKQIWTGIYETTKDEVVKERAKNYIIHLEILDLLDQATAQYFKINNKYPVDINDLVSARILKAIPVDPFGFLYEIDSNTGAITIK